MTLLIQPIGTTIKRFPRKRQIATIDVYQDISGNLLKRLFSKKSYCLGFLSNAIYDEYIR